MKKFFPRHKTKQPGYITLLAVLVVGTITLTISVSTLLLGLGSSKTSFALEQSNLAKALANTCAEEALEEIRESTTFAGTGNIVFGSDTCTYSVINNGGDNRSITVSGTVGDITRKAQIALNAINPSIQITSWQEVGN